jgi:alpha-1,3-rhamnosyl/mannosyltransferase
MLHDLIPLVVEAELFEAPARRWRHVGRRLRHAEIVCTNSWCTAVDAVRLFGVEEERIRVIPLGVGSHFQPPGSRARPHPPTVLYVGEYGPHKGFAEAFAVAGLIAEAGLPHDLEMASYLAPWYESIVRELLAHAPRPDRVKLLGYVDDIAPAYQRADALIVTSRYEGFCLPALEAMACGTPVVAFSNSAISEVVSGGGVLVPDGDVAALATALVDTLNDQVRWKEISDRGIEHARAFSWSRCAGAHADVFRAVAAGCR